MSIQSEFKRFNEKIQADYVSKRELADKRDTLIRILRKDDTIPSFEMFNQGSYILYTGIKPESGEEYDIDVGLLFNVNKSDYEPMELKNKIFDILENHTDYGAEIKKPCVTVTYKKGGKIAYHVDLVVYVYDNLDNENSQLFMAKGKSGNKESIKLEEADPKELVDYINSKIQNGEQRNQYRRIVRYLKKWKNRRFSNAGHVSPPSIGLTLLTLENYQHYVEDLDALIHVASEIERKFIDIGVSNDGQVLCRIYLPLPEHLRFEVPNDVFEKMTDRQMTEFKEKINKLIKDLKAVNDEIDEYEKYKKLNRIFGDDFEVPQEKSVAKQQPNYIPPSSSSGME